MEKIGNVNCNYENLKFILRAGFGKKGVKSSGVTVKREGEGVTERERERERGRERGRAVDKSSTR